MNSGTGILAGSGADLTTVRNGSISNFGICVALSNGGASVVEGLRVSACSEGIDANGIVKGNVVEDIVVGNGIASSGLISGNVVLGTHTGIVAGFNSTVIGNTIRPTLSIGLVVECPSNVIDNTVTGPAIALTGQGCNIANNVLPPGSP
jgi:hypothetical protein